jgi:hypothetical protein
MTLRKILPLALVLLLAACGPATERPLSSYTPPPDVEVHFTVLVPPGTLDEDIQLSIVDEVTGIAFNPQRYTMQPAGENGYAVSLSLPFGSLVKYRYVRQGAATTFEMAANGAAINYRELLVNRTSTTTNDVVAAWSDLPTQALPGQISGQVLDAESGAPIGGLRVSASGLHTATDPEGYFILGGLLQGQHNLVISSPHGAYTSFQQAALVAEDMDTPAYIQMHRTEMISVTFSLALPEDSVPSVPIYLVGNLAQLGGGAASPVELPRMQPGAEGRYTLTLPLPAGVDIRYKYTLGDGFWNAEHLPGGAFALRQLVLGAEGPSFTIEDQASQWTAGASAAIWFQVTPPARTEGPVYLQFKLLDWTAPVPMWTLGDGRWAYKLFSPTNFGTPLEYRYCLDSACASPELDSARTVTGNQENTQVLEDQVSNWQGQ